MSPEVIGFAIAAGIGYVEVVAGDAPAELRRVVERLVNKGAG